MELREKLKELIERMMEDEVDVSIFGLREGIMIYLPSGRSLEQINEVSEVFREILGEDKYETSVLRAEEKDAVILSFERIGD